MMGIFTGGAGDAWSFAAIVARRCHYATMHDFKIGEGADHDTGECKKLWSIRRGFDGRLGLDFCAGGFSVGANHAMSGESIERGDTGRLFDHSRGLRLEFSDGDDFAG
jgi:hypothetical protein